MRAPCRSGFLNPGSPSTTVEALVPAAGFSSRAVAAGFRERVEQHMQAQPESGDLRLRKLARELRLGSRTLQRRLEDEGTSNAQVLDRLREVRARALVGNGTEPLAEVAFALGFSEFATFSRAFKRWTGVAPGGFRSAATR